MTGEEKVKKNRDPIFTVCLVIFLLAAVAVVGVYINDHYIEKDDTKVAYGDTVTVNYTGSYYAYVDDREHAMVFDTSYRSVADNDKIIKSNSFASSKFEPLEFKVGGTTVLEAFGLSAVGHQVGDKYTVMIPADEANDEDRDTFEYVILKSEVDENGDESLFTIDDDEEFDRVADFFDDMFSTVDFDEN